MTDPIEFIDDDCKRAGQCCCGFCKRWSECSYGDCRRPMTTHCPVFKYRVCDKHATVNVPTVIGMTS